MKLSRLKSVFYTVYIFFFVFCPPIVPRFDVVLIAFSAIWIAINYRKNFFYTIKKSGALFWGQAMICLAIYILIVPLFVSAFIANDIVQVDNYTALINRYGLITGASLICSTFLFLELKKNKYGLNDFLKFLFWAGAIESCFSVGALISPQFKRLLISIMYQNTGSEIYINTWYTTTRSYGFANTLVDLFGLGVSVIASTCFVYGIFKNKKYIALSLFIIIPAALNARTGLILYAICVIISVVYISVKGNFKGFLLGVFFLIITVSGYNFLITSDILNLATKSWLQSGVDSVLQFVNGQSVQGDSLSVLLTDSTWELPKGIRLIIGTGHSKYRANGYSHSDVGYVNEIWMAGIIGACFLYAIIVLLTYKSAIKYNGNLTKTIGIIICVGYFIFNIKAVALGYNPGAASILLIIFAMKYFQPMKGNKNVSN